MIGHYLLTLTPEQEDRVLGEKLARAPSYVRDDGCRCLVGVVADVYRKPDHFIARDFSGSINSARAPNQHCVVGIRFDDLCERFGERRVNAAIRNRILSNRAQRVLAAQVSVTA